MEARFENKKTSDLSELLAESERYRDKLFSNFENSPFKPLQNGQNPKTHLIACSDSRLVPTDIFRLVPGKAFASRNVGNFVSPFDESPPSETAIALEYSVTILGVTQIVLLGHSRCGYVQTAVEVAKHQSPLHQHSLVRGWANKVVPSVACSLEEHEHKSPEEQSRYAEEASLLCSLKNLVTYPFIKERVDDGALSLHACRFDITSGKISIYHPTKNAFVDSNDYQDKHETSGMQRPPAP